MAEIPLEQNLDAPRMVFVPNETETITETAAEDLEATDDVALDITLTHGAEDFPVANPGELIPTSRSKLLTSEEWTQDDSLLAQMEARENREAGADARARCSAV